MQNSQHVLIIDDVLAVRESIRIALNAAGFTTSIAENGQQALEVLSSGSFDVVVTDIWMPGVDGITLIKRLRSQQPKLRVFAVTGGGPRMTTETATSLAEIWGAERVFVKPFDEALLIAAINGKDH